MLSHRLKNILIITYSAMIHIIDNFYLFYRENVLLVISKIILIVGLIVCQV